MLGVFVSGNAMLNIVKFGFARVGHVRAG